MKLELEKMDDAELVLFVANGRAKAFEMLYERHCDGVARLLASFAGYNQDVIDDLVQEVFFRVIKGLKTYRPNRLFSKYLYTIALNVGRNNVRSDRRKAVQENCLGENDYPDPKQSNDWAIKLMEIRAFELVKELPAQLQEVVALRISSDMKFRQIAEILKIPESSARRRMHEAMTILRKKMGLSSAKKELDNE